VTLLGAHVPVTGGLHNAPANGRAIGAEAIQIFTRSQLQWKAKPVTPEEVHAFRGAMVESGVQSVMTHGSYLVNLAALDAAILERSRDTFAADMERCHALGIPYLVFHPGAHLGAGREAGLRAIARSLDDILARDSGPSVSPLLEVTAGQGSCLGERFEDLAEILRLVRDPARLGVCLDTCHLYAAGYDIANPRGYERAVADLDRLVGLSKVKAFHLNDAKKGLGSRLDRHARIGTGTLGLATFRRIVNDPRFAGVPMVVETPGPLAEWKKEVALLRRLRRRARVREDVPRAATAR
jgi:deoxyribonuclease IV